MGVDEEVSMQMRRCRGPRLRVAPVPNLNVSLELERRRADEGWGSRGAEGGMIGVHVEQGDEPHT